MNQSSNQDGVTYNSLETSSASTANVAVSPTSEISTSVSIIEKVLFIVHCQVPKFESKQNNYYILNFNNNIYL